MSESDENRGTGNNETADPLTVGLVLFSEFYEFFDGCASGIAESGSEFAKKFDGSVEFFQARHDGERGRVLMQARLFKRHQADAAKQGSDDLQAVLNFKAFGLDLGKAFGDAPKLITKNVDSG